MKRMIFLLTGLLLSVGTVAAKTTNESNSSSLNFNRGYGNSFIFVEDGIEFSVFQDGQFDFYAQAFGPNVSIGVNSGPVSFSFNSGYNYDPFVQYDSFGAVIQIENTPVFYDYYGRVSQIGDIFINYNNFGRVSLIGGLQVFYRNRAFSHFSGFINFNNRGYVYRPWHRFYTVPAFNLCLINTVPYRQFYVPVRHIYYRPYANNFRFSRGFNRSIYSNVGRRSNEVFFNRYAQSPRSARDRQIQNRVERRYSNIATTRSRNSRLASADLGTRYNTTVRNNSSDSRRSSGVTTRNSRDSRVVQNTSTRRTDNSGIKRSQTRNDRSVRNTTSVSRVDRSNNNSNVRSTSKVVNKKSATINRNAGRQNAKVSTSNRTSVSKNNKARPQTRTSAVQNSRNSKPVVKQRTIERKSSVNKPSKGRSSNTKSTNSNSRRSRGQ